MSLRSFRGPYALSRYDSVPSGCPDVVARVCRGLRSVNYAFALLITVLDLFL
jgi:hypothetical protein